MFSRYLEGVRCSEGCRAPRVGLPPVRGGKGGAQKGARCITGLVPSCQAGCRSSLQRPFRSEGVKSCRRGAAAGEGRGGGSGGPLGEPSAPCCRGSLVRSLKKGSGL